MRHLLFILFFSLGLTFVLSGCGGDSDDDTSSTGCTDVDSVFTIDLDAGNCNVDIENSLGVSSAYSEGVAGITRTITVNNIANHKVGAFPKVGNPFTIAAVTETYTMTTMPSAAANVTYGQGFTTGILFSGVVVEPYTAEFFEGTGGVNMEWNITTLQSTRSLGLDCNNAHVQPTGRYHYHGTPSAYLDALGTADGSQMVKVGYAADGYPIYYKYGYADDGTSIEAYASGYRLKTAERGGDGSTAPDGCPDGYYFQDYEYVSGVSDLDECNGKTGKTPEAASEYYYVITDNFPSVPLCFTGTPDNSFHH